MKFIQILIKYKRVSPFSFSIISVLHESQMTYDVIFNIST